MLQTPVLFLIFNRPDTTKLVFESIRNIKPKQLFIAADGARNDKAGEEQLCAETRAIVATIDWDCEVKTLFQSSNLGCRNAVSTAINWFFDNIEAGIILEDDCLPHESFFAFCEENLQRYKQDELVMHIGGTNFQKGNKRGEASYYFSYYNHIWGWASWKRAWEKYQVDMPDYTEVETQKMLTGLFSSKREIKLWEKLFKEAFLKNVNTWDYQWTYAIWKNKGLSIVPNVNLVANLGFGNGTHTNQSDVMGLGNMPVHSVLPITHPKNKTPNQQADSFTFTNYFAPNLYTYLKAKIRNFLFNSA